MTWPGHDWTGVGTVTYEGGNEDGQPANQRPPVPPRPPTPPAAGPQPTLPAYPQQPPGGPGGAPGPAPGPPWPTPPPPPRRGGGRVTAILAIVVLLLAGGIAVALFEHDGSGDPAAKKSSRPAHALRQKWETRLPDAHVRGTLSGLPALWTTSRGPVYADDNGVRAFDPETGRTLWTVRTPKGASEVCAIAPRPNSDGVGAAVYDAGGDDCAYLVVFDTDTGRTLWSKNLARDSKSFTPHVEVGEDVVVAGIGPVSAYAISGGEKKWTLTSRGRDCGTDIAWSAGYLAASSSCSDVTPENQLSILDLRDGDADSWKFPNEKRDVELVVGNDPLTLMLAEEEDGNDTKRYLQTYTKDGKPDKTFPMTGKRKNLQFDPTATAVGDDSVLLSSYDNTSGLGATDLRTGTVLWSKADTIQIGLESGKVLAVKAPEQPGQDPNVVSIGLRDGKEAARGLLLTPRHSLSRVQSLTAGVWGGTLYVVNQEIDDPKGGRVLRAFDISG
ncbi:PQQ-binding-like beta-propeller repeat protein [Streptomyces sp. NPDC020480]|uniref:outer membrane protein assembly factor BamB family protein n=1 Tax=Streptomyces sp. NPDC020480 TaxID=3365076 RepID=UPI0037B99451